MTWWQLAITVDLGLNVLVVAVLVAGVELRDWRARRRGPQPVRLCSPLPAEALEQWRKGWEDYASTLGRER